MMYIESLPLVINNLIYLNKERRLHEEIIFHKNHKDPFNYAIQFCTISLNIGRVAGYSTYIKKMTTDHDVIVCKNGCLADEINRETSATVLSTEKFKHLAHNMRGRQFPHVETVYVDCASSMTDRQIFEIYDYYCNFRLQCGVAVMIPTFVLLG